MKEERILVTGAAGFVGRHMARELASVGHHVIPSCRTHGPAEAHILDITDRAAVDQLVASIQPDAVVHLAGLSFVPDAAKNPDLAIDVNVNGTIHLLRACQTHVPGARVLVVTSAEVYGLQPRPARIHETAPLAPSNIYGLTKATADLATLRWAADHGLHAMTARPQNHLGPGQSHRFVSSGFAERIARRSLAPDPLPLKRGNLESTRNFTDVRDVVRAYRLILDHGQAGQAYNVASPQTTRIGDLLETLFDIAGVPAEHEPHEPYFRPTTHPPTLAIDRLQIELGWQPTIPLRQTLDDLYAATLQHLRDTGAAG